jgi:hypothetical protein
VLRYIKHYLPRQPLYSCDCKLKFRLIYDGERFVDVIMRTKSLTCGWFSSKCEKPQLQCACAGIYQVLLDLGVELLLWSYATRPTAPSLISLEGKSLLFQWLLQR